MAENLKVSRTEISLKGKVDEEKLQRIFEEACADRRANMVIEYDKRKDITRVLLSPCKVTEFMEPGADGKPLNYRTIFELDKSTMSDALNNLGGTKSVFIEKIWMPFKKVQTQKNVSLPDILEHSDHYSFELLTDEHYQCSKKAVPATTKFRNEKMKASEHFLLEFFAKSVERSKPSRSSAKLLDELSMAIADSIAS